MIIPNSGWRRGVAAASIALGLALSTAAEGQTPPTESQAPAPTSEGQTASASEPGETSPAAAPESLLQPLVVTAPPPVSASSELFIPGRDFELRPQGRPADLLRLVPGLVIS